MKMVALKNPTEFDERRSRDVIDQHAALAGACLPVLHALQHEFGFVDARNVPLIAEALNISKAEVHGVISFYHDFKHAPPTRHILKLCRAEACQSMGSDDLVERLAQFHGCTANEPTADGALTFEPVYCLGNCALSPAALFDGEPVGRINDARLDALVARSRGGA
jgi:formate dehydrogenase subunit gamma